MKESLLLSLMRRVVTSLERYTLFDTVSVGRQDCPLVNVMIESLQLVRSYYTSTYHKWSMGHQQCLGPLFLPFNQGTRIPSK
jgi:hypothetical protein